METLNVQGAVPIKMWTEGVPVETAARNQLINTAKLPFIYSHVAVMPDVHYGRGATVGSVIPTQGAIIPAAVGVDIGCGMVAASTTLTANNLPSDLKPLRTSIERRIPVGFGSHDTPPDPVQVAWAERFADEWGRIAETHPKARGKESPACQLGTLGGGNHFIEICLDERDRVWAFLHSGSRGVGNRIGTYFIDQAKKAMDRQAITLPDRDLAYLAEGDPVFTQYMGALQWAQRYAMENRRQMLRAVVTTLRRDIGPFTVEQEINCHHNFTQKEVHFGQEVWVTRKGAVQAQVGQMGLIPGSMGTRSYVVRGLGNPESFASCSHGAGRAMSRGEAKRRFTVAQHVTATAGIECRKDAGVLDETPMAYKSIDAVMAAQADLVEVVHELRQVLCVKG